MREDVFEELLESVRQGGQILRGERKPGRVFTGAEPDARKIRQLYGLSQEKFAKLMGISVATLRNWEQGRRSPEGPARVLLEAMKMELPVRAPTDGRVKAVLCQTGELVQPGVTLVELDGEQ